MIQKVGIADLNVYISIFKVTFSPFRPSVESINKEDLKASDSPDFGQDVDPLILACHCNDYVMVDMLLRKGFRIERPHPPNCKLTIHFYFTFMN